MRSPLTLLTMVLMSVALAGCAGMGTVCSAVGYSSVATITLSEPREGISLELCDGEDCEPGVPPRGEVEPAETSPVPFADTGVVRLDGESVNGWSATFVAGQPLVGYRLRDAAGEIISEDSIEVDWVRVGGTERCGGPNEAVIELPN